MRRVLIILLLCLPMLMFGEGAAPQPAAPDSTVSNGIYQGTIVRLDVGNTALMAGLSRGKIITTEAAVSCRLKNRFYPVAELGYALANNVGAAGGTHHGQGAFLRLGTDISILKRHPESYNALLAGVRLGTCMQGYSLSGVTWNSSLDTELHDYPNRFRADCWGEFVLGCQVQIYRGLLMGWAVRAKVLFSRNVKEGRVLPYYLPGYGYRSNTNWGLNYYIAYKF